MNRAPASRGPPRSGVPSARARRWSWPQISLWTRQVRRPHPTVVTVQLDVEDLDVMLLDLVAHLFDRSGVILHDLDVLERRAAGLFLSLRMHGPQAPDIDDQLLAFRSETVSRKQLGSVRIWGGFEHPVRILVFGRIELGDVFRDKGFQQSALLPDDRMRRIRGIDDVARVDVAGIFLTDPLKHAFGA